LPTVVQKALTKGDFSAGKARALLSLKTEKEQVDMFESMMGIKMSVREVENLVANKKNNNKTHKDPNMTAQEKKMEERLGAKVIISGNIKKGKIMISYSSTDELKRLISELS